MIDAVRLYPMPPRLRRKPKRHAAPKEDPPGVSVEAVPQSHVGGHSSKKRIIEKAPVDPQSAAAALASLELDKSDGDNPSPDANPERPDSPGEVSNLSSHWAPQ